MFVDFDVNVERDLSKNRRVTLDNGQVWFIRQKADCPYGFWTVHAEKGKIPKELGSQKFTGPSLAERAIKEYLNKWTFKKVEKVEKGFGVVTDIEGNSINA